MKTTGQILHESRLAQKLDLEDIARITKIRSQALRIIEADDYSHLPDSTVAKGFIRNYAKFLNLNPEHVLAVFRRDFIENKLGQIVPRGLADPVDRVSFWTPRTTILAAVSALFILFAGYLFYQYRVLIGPPYLQVDRPPDHLVLKQGSVEISGKTDPEATLSVDNQLVVLDKGGRFYLRLPLNPGVNKISITATGKSGQTTTITRIVSLTTAP